MAATEHERLLSEAERTRLAALRAPADRDRFRTAHVLARVLLGDRLHREPAAITIGARCHRCGGPHGQPLVLDPSGTGWHLSLSHAGDRVAVAMASDPVGIDLEPLGSAPPGVAQVSLTRRERCQLDGFPEALRRDALTRWWVCKEAVVKAAGLGLTVDLRTIEVSAPPAPPQVVRWRGAPGRFRLTEVDVGAGYWAVLATTGRRRPAVERRQVDLSGGDRALARTSLRPSAEPGRPPPRPPSP